MHPSCSGVYYGVFRQCFVSSVEHENYKRHEYEQYVSMKIYTTSLVYNTCLVLHKFLIGKGFYHMTLLFQYTTCLVSSIMV